MANVNKLMHSLKMCEIITKHQLLTELPACSVEWCREHPEIFAVGLYHLDKKDENVSANNKREGRIELYNYSESGLEKLQSVETDAILDQRWMNDKLYTATSSGAIECFQLNCNDEKKNLVKVNSVKLQDKVPDCLALSLDIRKDQQMIAASDSKGKISILDVQENRTLHQFDAHELEAWTVAFDNFNHNVIFSGDFNACDDFS